MEESFYLNFNNNLQKIFNISDEISGKHEINLEKSELWISSQLNENRRQAAQVLIDNTYYITFKKPFDQPLKTF